MGEAWGWRVVFAIMVLSSFTTIINGSSHRTCFCPLEGHGKSLYGEWSKALHWTGSESAVFFSFFGA